MNSPSLRRTAGSALLIVCTAAAAAHAQGDKLELRFRPPAGEAIRYRDRFEAWVSVGSHTARGPSLSIDIWTTETATTHGDSITIVSIVDSARARGVGVPPELDQTAQMMHGTRETTVYDTRGRELVHTVRGITEADVFAVLTGAPAAKQEEYRQWRTLPEDSVQVGGEWTDSVHIRVDTTDWRGRIDYRLRRIERKGNTYVGRVTSSGTLRTSDRQLAPVHVSSEAVIDAETSRLIEATVHQDGGIAGYYASIDIRNIWHIERVP